jgi:hypothetical protein
MKHVPLEARRVVDELRSTPQPLSGALPSTWVPSQSFDSLLEDAGAAPILLDEHLQWLQENWNLTQSLAAPAGGGAKGWARRLINRAVLAALRPHLLEVQACIAETVRALEAVARRVDDQAATQLRTIGAVRADLVDFAQHVDGRLEE